jgi:hypothetical protein
LDNAATFEPKDHAPSDGKAWDNQGECNRGCVSDIGELSMNLWEEIVHFDDVLQEREQEASREFPDVQNYISLSRCSDRN